ncbi:MAG: nitrilase-related carbon-nitrogen hydrolase [Candidatus Kariarchaeaceae archaeon]|jgi:predicted amidohydrolase
MVEIFLYQMDVEFGDPEKNFKKIDQVLADADLQKGTLAVLPELFLTGYHKESIDASAVELPTGEALDRLIQLARKQGIGIFGSIAEVENDKYYNTAVLVTKDGLVGKYRKSHLFGPMGEKNLFAPGRSVATLKFQNISFGLSICYDLRFPALYQAHAEQGVDIILVVAEWPITRVNHWSALLRARAIENQVFVIGVNRVGTDPDYEYGGHSGVYTPFGDFAFGIENANSGTIAGTIDLDLIKEFRQKFDIREDKWKI